MNPLSHLDAQGKARMVDVSAKAPSARRAVARGRLTAAAETLALIRAGTAPKGDVLAAARIAGIMAAKRTAGLIPLCHPLPITAVRLDFELRDEAVAIEAEVKVNGQTGVEMEALTAVCVAALTLYDMLKAVDKGMRIEAVRLVHKSGGRTGRFDAPDAG
ncbi:MAG: cyclic pyranopterin monophosphate synthase MoaC [Alphaproteobacteria bacterium]|nr:MAG: cyclic pyranopterin monophosphate synthase MoaC [Alphaproteobacteria bacterium]